MLRGPQSERANKYSGDNFLGQRATRWDAGGSAITELDNLGANDDGVTNTYVYAINTAGTSVGYADQWLLHLTTPYYSAVRWNAGGTAATKLDSLHASIDGFTYSKAFAINDFGTIVGSSDKFDSSGRTDLGPRPVRWDAGGTAVTELDNIGTDPNGYTACQVNAINTVGTAVGYATKYNGNPNIANAGSRATRWSAGGTAVTELGNLGTDTNGSSSTEAYDINASGTAVGYAQKYSEDGTFIRTSAVAWGPDGVAFDLNTLLDPNSGWTLNRADHISDTNWVDGIGTYDPEGDGPLSAYDREFLIQLPEPSAGFALAFLAVALPRRRGRFNSHTQFRW